jgi:hypothetical protein
VKRLRITKATHEHITALAVVIHGGNVDQTLKDLITSYEKTNPAVATDVKNYLQLQKTIVDEKINYGR